MNEIDIHPAGQSARGLWHAFGVPARRVSGARPREILLTGGEREVTARGTNDTGLATTQHATGERNTGRSTASSGT